MTVGLRYADLVSVLPTRVKVFAWPMNQFKKNGALGTHPGPVRLSYAEDALRTMSLPEGATFLQLCSFLFIRVKDYH